MIDQSLLTKPVPGIKPKMSKRVCNQFHKHAMDAYPNEATGFVDKKGQYHRLDNIAEDPAKTARISHDDMLRVMEEGKMYCHSHPDGPNCPSGADIMAAREMALPQALIATNGEACLAPVFFGDVIEKPPLLGRGFIHGFTDCFGLGLDFYKVVMGIELPEHPRDWQWWDDKQLSDSSEGLYLDHFEEMGFEQVDGDLQVGDVFLLRVASRVPNHAGYYVGSHCMIHHLTGRMENDPTRLSTVEPLVRWQQHHRIDRVLRYRGGVRGCSEQSGSTGG